MILDDAQRRYVTLDDPVARTLATEDPAPFLPRYAPPVLIDELTRQRPGGRV